MQHTECSCMLPVCSFLAKAFSGHRTECACPCTRPSHLLSLSVSSTWACTPTLLELSWMGLGWAGRGMGSQSRSSEASSEAVALPTRRPRCRWLLCGHTEGGAEYSDPHGAGPCPWGLAASTPSLPHEISGGDRCAPLWGQTPPFSPGNVLCTRAHSFPVSGQQEGGRLRLWGGGQRRFQRL